MKRLLPALLLLIACCTTRAQAPAVRGFHVDLRIQVMKMPALKQLALQLSQQGINTLVMEWEGAYPFETEPVIPNRYAYTHGEVTDFIHYCDSLHMDVIPLQQSFGHVEYILRHPRYAALREDSRDYSQVCPSQLEANKALFTRLFKEMAATHHSPYIHIGCDETHLLGHCPLCRQRAKNGGVSKLYFDHVKMLCDIVISLGKIPVLWADIALKYPEYLQQLPKQAVLVDWNYGWALDRFGDHRKLLQSGYQIWGSPALRSDPDNYFYTGWQRHFNNIHDFVPTTRQLGYKGIVMTSWSTSGEYDAVFNATGDLTDLYPVRNVYPISGFNMLIAAFTQSIRQARALDTDSFITRYCREQYGLDAATAADFRRVLFCARPGTQGLDSAAWSARTLHAMHPTRHADEFEHYRLMADVRVYYLRYNAIEAALNKDDHPDLAKYAAQLKGLMDTEPALNETFTRLNARVLYPSATVNENEIRCYKTHQLYARITRTR